MANKIKVGKKEVELQLITLDKRCEILDLAMEASKGTSFTKFVDVIRLSTKLTDEDIMEYSTEEISEIALEIVEHCNAGKKQGKSK